MPTRPATPDRPVAQTIYLLSPAHCGGRRARILLGERAAFPLAVQLRDGGAPLGEVFRFLSGLYFRGKLAYAERFAFHTNAPHGVLVITPGRGLVPPETIVTIDELQRIAELGVAPDEPRFRDPLKRDVSALAKTLSGYDQVVLLGSIATGKYVDVIERELDGRLRFPIDFVGRGDMSRGGLMLRCVQDEKRLVYVPIAGAVRHGSRPPKLEPIR